MNIIVIGGGPCGIFSALSIKKNNPSYNVTLIEKEKDIGSRIKISGNGRCNLGNINIKENKYNDSSFVKSILLYKEEYFKYLDEVGLSYYHDDEGRIYPNSESSLSVIHSLKLLLKKYQIDLKLLEKVISIKNENGLVIETDKNKYYPDKIVLSIGGLSNNNDKINYNLLIKQLASISQLSPSLTPISTSSFRKEMEGKRVKANVKLLCNNQVIKEEKGEILFKKDGVSGIVIFNISSYLARLHLSSYANYKLSIDLLPNMTKEEYFHYKEKDSSLINLLNEEIAKEITLNNFDPKNYMLNIRGLYDLKFSQVTSGGILLSEINKNLSLKKSNNIYVGGEEIDIDGECGGYNIEFAALCGIKIGKEI